MPAPTGILAVIPARGGSKRIPGKNVRLFRGRPMISHTVEAALGCGAFDRVIVSTDNDDIARTAQDAGAEIPFIRSSTLADDLTPVSAATADALDRLDPDDLHFASVCQLMANCPLRTAEDIRSSYQAFCAGRVDAQLSVTRFGSLNPLWAMRIDERRRLTPLFDAQATARSQDLPDLVCPTGAVWWAKAGVLRRERTYHVPGRTGWVIPWPRGLDIDTEDDWRLAEMLAGMGADASA
jgi:CMP-N-acetylneuraminic acid synthetase